jgi:hypothetical protein
MKKTESVIDLIKLRNMIESKIDEKVDEVQDKFNGYTIVVHSRALRSTISIFILPSQPTYTMERDGFIFEIDEKIDRKTASKIIDELFKRRK